MQETRRKVGIRQTAKVEVESHTGDQAAHWNHAHCQWLRSQTPCEGKVGRAGHPLNGRQGIRLRRRVGRWFAVDKSGEEIGKAGRLINPEYEPGQD